MITLRHACLEDLSAIVRVHQAAFPRFYLTRMGPWFLRIYYGTILDYDGSVFVVAQDEERVIGFAAGVMDAPRFYKALSRAKRKAILPITWALLKNPLLFVETVSNVVRVRQSRDQDTEAGSRCELTSIGVLPAYKGHGIGKQVLTTFIAKAQSMAATHVALTTDAEQNDAVNAFYQKQGFTLTRRIQRTKKRCMNEYVLRLSR